VRELERAQPVVLVREIQAADWAAQPQRCKVLYERVVAPCIAPAFDAPDVCAKLPAAGLVVGPDIAVTMDTVGAGVGFGGADVEGRGAVDGFLKGGGGAGEFGDVVTEFGADGGFAVAGGDAAEEVVHEGCVAGGIGEEGEGGGAGGARADAIAVGGVGGVLLLEVNEAIGDGSGIDAIGDFHAAGRNVAEEIPPFRVVGEGGVSYAGDKTGDVEEVVDFGEVGVREGVAGEAPQDTS